MSDALYYTRLRFKAGRGGIAKYHGRAIQLESAPAIPGLDIEEILYTPETRVERIKLVGQPAREMLMHEKQACDVFLKEVTFNAEDDGGESG